MPTLPRRRVHIPGGKLLAGIPLIALLVMGGADLASVALVKLSAPDDAGEAARAGVAAVEFDRSATPQTAQEAYDAANEVAELHRLDIDEKSFVIREDGSVEFTAHRSSPTLLFKHLPGLRDLTETTISASATRADW